MIDFGGLILVLEKEFCRIPLGCARELLEIDSLEIRYMVRNVRYECWLIYHTTLWNRRQEGRVGFKKQVINRDRSEHGALFFVLRKGRYAINTHKKLPFQCMI